MEWAYVLLAFVFFFSSRNLLAPSADRCIILYDAWKCVQFCYPDPKFQGKNFRGENMQNLVQFRLTSNFAGEYLWNG